MPDQVKTPEVTPQVTPEVQPGTIEPAKLGHKFRDYSVQDLIKELKKSTKSQAAQELADLVLLKLDYTAEEIANMVEDIPRRMTRDVYNTKEATEYLANAFRELAYNPNAAKAAAHSAGLVVSAAGDPLKDTWQDGYEEGFRAALKKKQSTMGSGFDID